MTWETVKLKEVISHRKGFIEIDDETEYKLVTVKLHRKGVILRENLKGYQIKTKKQQVCKAGDFIVAEMDAKFGGYGFVPDDLEGAIVSSHYFLFEVDEYKLRPQYLEVISQVKILQEQIKAIGSTNYSSIRPYNVLEWEIPLPPIEKQKEIEALYIKAKSKVDLLNDEYQLQLSEIENLNQAILQEASQGKLVLQDKKDEPASDLLRRIKAEKQILIEQRKIKQGKLQEAETLDELLFDIPDNWVWCKLDEICKNITDGTHQTPKYTKSGRIFLSAQNVKPFKFIPEVHKYVSEEAYKEYVKNRKPEMGDLLIGRVGAGIGETAVIDQDLDFCIYVSLALVQPFKDFIDSNYLAYVFNSPYGYKYAKGNISSKGGSAGNFNLGRIRSFLIPLPPLSEQKRIVSEIEKQFVKTNQLKEYIIACQQATGQLLNNLLQQAFEGKDHAEAIAKSEGNVIELKSPTIKWDTLVAGPLEKYPAHPVNNIQNIDWEMALMVACMKNKLGVTYGDVGLQKNVFNTNNLQPIFSKRYGFVNSNFGTYSHELKDDLKRNPYLISQKVANNKEVYAINPKYSKEILNRLSAPENKGFVQAINRMLSIYEHPFINKETDKIELYNTVLKVALDKSTTHIGVIYQGMKDWKIKQTGYKTKAEKFTKPDAEKILKLLIDKKILK